MITPEQLERELNPAPDPRLEGVPELPPGLYGYPPAPRFLRADSWPVEGWKGRWYVIGPAAELLEAETVDVKQFNGHVSVIQPLDPVGWRLVKKKGRGTVLYVLMTFDKAVYETAGGSLGGEPISG